MFICSLYSIILTSDSFSLITYLVFFVYWLIYTLSWHCFHLVPKPNTAVAMHNQNRLCLKNKNNNLTDSVFRCLFETNMPIPVLWNIYTLTCIKNTLRERWLFQRQRVEFRRKKTLYFWIKYCEKIAGKAVLDDLNYKIFFASQPWWPTGFLGIYQLTVQNLKWPPKNGIIWSRWPPAFKMLFPAL